MNVFAEMIEEDLMECPRCGRLCVLGKKSNPDAMPLKRVTDKAEAERKGLCVDCAATAFIKGIDVLMAGIEQNGVKILLDARVAKQFGAVMQAGNSDAKPEELSWQNIVDNWDKPIPKSNKGGGSGVDVTFPLKSKSSRPQERHIITAVRRASNLSIIKHMGRAAYLRLVIWQVRDDRKRICRTLA